jgi:hypothetical protein
MSVTRLWDKRTRNIGSIPGRKRELLSPPNRPDWLWTPTMYSGTSVHERLSSRTNRFTNKFSEQKTSRITNGVSSNEHASRQQRLATSWEYRRESVSCCVTFAQYTSLLKFAAPSFEFHCVLCFFKYIVK